MLEQDTVVEDNDTDVALESEELNEEAPIYDDMESDKLIEELQKRDGEIAKSKKSYDEFRSMTDRKATEVGERLAKMEGRLEATAVEPVEKEADFSDLIAEMKGKIEEDPANMAEYLVRFAQEMNATMGEQKQAIQSDVQSRIARESAVYKNNKDFVNKCVDRGMSLPDALEFVSEVKGAEKVAQPGTPKAPGVVEAGRSVDSRPATQQYTISAHDRSVMEDAGMDEKEIQEIAKQVAKDMENV